jgi:transposase, IS30 family
MLPRAHYRHVSFAERSQIHALRRVGLCPAAIARTLGRHRSTIVRELRRCRSRYLPDAAERHAARCRRASAGRPELLATPEGQAMLVQLAVVMERRRRSLLQALVELGDPHPAATATLVYRWIARHRHSDTATSLSRRLNDALIRPHRPGRKRARSGPKRSQPRIRNMTGIEHRPQEATARAVVGHWEGDLIYGAGPRRVFITVVDRASRLTRILVPASRKSHHVIAALTAWTNHSGNTVKSLTWDRGLEMGAHADYTAATGVPIYFCPPHQPWRRGTNENTNGVLRRYWPKRTPLPTRRAEIHRVETLLNTRPLATQCWMTPEELYDHLTR